MVADTPLYRASSSARGREAKRLLIAAALGIQLELLVSTSESWCGVQSQNPVSRSPSLSRYFHRPGVSNPAVSRRNVVPSPGARSQIPAQTPEFRVCPKVRTVTEFRCTELREESQSNSDEYDWKFLNAKARRSRRAETHPWRACSSQWR